MITVKKKLGPVGELFLSLIFAAAGLAIVYFMGSSFTLTCHRNENTCTIEEDNIFRTKEINATLNLSDIEKAEVVESRDSKGKSHYQVMLLTHEMRVPIADNLTGKYSSCRKKVDKINQYIDSSDQDLSVTESGKIPMLLGLFFAAVGAWVFLQFLWKMVKRILGLILVLANK
ncbi:MAG: hypothetical protein HZB24_05975 [Desulfobacterales bacterium]|nr:hypothetical protein [Desulfobacterales bacterium]